MILFEARAKYASFNLNDSHHFLMLMWTFKWSILTFAALTKYSNIDLIKNKVRHVEKI